MDEILHARIGVDGETHIRLRIAGGIARDRAGAAIEAKLDVAVLDLAVRATLDARNLDDPGRHLVARRIPLDGGIGRPLAAAGPLGDETAERAVQLVVHT